MIALREPSADNQSPLLRTVVGTDLNKAVMVQRELTSFAYLTLITLIDVASANI